MDTDRVEYHGEINENIMLTNEYLIDKIAHCYLYYVKTISFPAEISNLMTINLDGQSYLHIYVL